MKALQVWNTFFADSCWDSGREPGYEGTQTVNVVVFCSMVVKSEDELFEGKSKVCVRSGVDAAIDVPTSFGLFPPSSLVYTQGSLCLQFAFHFVF